MEGVMKRILLGIFMMLCLLPIQAHGEEGLDNNHYEELVYDGINDYLSVLLGRRLSHDDIVIIDVLNASDVVFKYLHQTSMESKWVEDVIRLSLPVSYPDAHFEMKLHYQEGLYKIDYHVELIQSSSGKFYDYFAWNLASSEGIFAIVESDQGSYRFPLSVSHVEGKTIALSGMRMMAFAGETRFNVKIVTRYKGNDIILASRDQLTLAGGKARIIDNISLQDHEGLLLDDLYLDESFMYEPCLIKVGASTLVYQGEGQSLQEALYSFLLDVRDLEATYQVITYDFTSRDVSGRFLFGELQAREIDLTLDFPQKVYSGVPFKVYSSRGDNLRLDYGMESYLLKEGVNTFTAHPGDCYDPSVWYHDTLVLHKRLINIDYSSMSHVYVEDFLKIGEKIAVKDQSFNDPAIVAIESQLMVNGQARRMEDYRACYGDQVVIRSSLRLDYQGSEYPIEGKELEVSVLAKREKAAYLIANDSNFYRRDAKDVILLASEGVKQVWEYSRHNDMDFQATDSPLTGGKLSFEKCGSYQWLAYDGDRVIKRKIFQVINRPPLVQLRLGERDDKQYQVGIIIPDDVSQSYADAMHDALNRYQIELMRRGIPLTLDIRNKKGQLTSDTLTYLSEQSTKRPPAFVNYDDNGFTGKLNLVEEHFYDRYIDQGAYEEVREEKYFYREHMNIKESHGSYNPWTSFVDRESPAPASYSINSDGYQGMLPRIGTIEHYHVRLDNDVNSWTSVGAWTAQYGGRLSKTNTVWVSDYRHYRYYVGEYQGEITRRDCDTLLGFDVGGQVATISVSANGDDGTYMSHHCESYEEVKATIEGLIDALSLSDQSIYLLGEDVEVLHEISDEDGDDVRVSHYAISYASIFDNPLPLPMLSEWESLSLDHVFANVGHYAVKACAIDGSMGYEFAEESESLAVDLTMHRKPVAKASLSIAMEEGFGVLTIHDESFDPDRVNSPNRGIYKTDSVIVNCESGELYRGRHHSIPQGDYRLTLRVYDEFFQASEPLSIPFRVSDSGLSYIDASLDKEVYSVGEEVVIETLHLVNDEAVGLTITLGGQEVARLDKSQAIKIGDRTFSYPASFSWPVIDNGVVVLRILADGMDEAIATAIDLRSETDCRLELRPNQLVKGVMSKVELEVIPFLGSLSVSVNGKNMVLDDDDGTYSFSYEADGDQVTLEIYNHCSLAPTLSKHWTRQLPIIAFDLTDLDIKGIWTHSDNVHEYFPSEILDRGFFASDTILVEGTYLGMVTSGVLKIDGRSYEVDLDEGCFSVTGKLSDDGNEGFTRMSVIQLEFYQEENVIFSVEEQLYLGPSIYKFLFFRPSD